MLKKITLYLILVIIGSESIKAQTHEWAFDIKSSAASILLVRAQAVDDSGNVYLGGVYRDSIYLPRDTFYFASSSNVTFFVAKYDKDGQYIWGKSFTNVSSASIAKIVINSQNQIILYGNYSQSSSSSITFGSYSLTKTASVFVAFLNSSGSFTYARDLGFGFFTRADNIAIGTDNSIHASYYLNGFGSNWTINDSLNPQTGSGYVHVIAKYSMDGKTLLWQKNYSITDVGPIQALAVDRNNQVYYSFVAEPSKTIFGTATGTTRKIFLVWLRPNGIVKDFIMSSNTNFSAIIQHLAAVDSNAIYLSGYTRGDSISLANTNIKSLSANPTKLFYFVAELKNFDSIGWYRSTSHIGANGNCQMNINGDYLYFSSVQNSNGFSFAGFSRTGFIATVVSKFDRLGNLLWYLPLNSTISPLLSSISNQDLLYSGGFKSQLVLNPFTLNNPRSKENPFVAKTYDYSITRGNVFKGPYCAGDTILIPYIAAGKYDTSNIFTAELSDEKGEFFGGQRTLGQLKYNKDSLVVGKLPLFRVASSKKYRIRITSSQPTVQSYYQLDTLNLLIYSTDKADPGPDTSICFGDTLMLKTYGGTQWKWFPNYAMNDSTRRTPLVYPLKDTIYTIIISDSSGCGAPDTADIRIKIKPSPVIIAGSQSDTVVCAGETVNFMLEVADGIGEYFVQWNSVSIGKLKYSKLIGSFDTLKLKVPRNLQIFATLTDSCSSKFDTIYFDIKTHANTEILNKPKDTTLCIGQALFANFDLKHAKKDSIRFQWFEKGSSIPFSTDSFISQSFSKDLTIRTIITNSCTQETIFHNFNVKLNAPLVSKIEQKASRDSFCSGSKITLNASSTGGNSFSSGRTFKWVLNNKTIIADSFIISVDSLLAANSSIRNHTAYLITDDNCTLPLDTTSYSFYVFPPLKIDSLAGFDSVLCIGSNMVLQAYAKGGLSKNFSYQWSFANKILGNAASIDLHSDSFKSNQKHSIILTLNDACSSPDSLKVQFRIPDSLRVSINSNLTNNTLCDANQAIFTKNAKGGLMDKYTWNWYLNNKRVSSSDSFLLYDSPHFGFKDSVLNLSIQLSDACNVPSATDSMVIAISPVPVVSFSKDSLKRHQTTDTVLCRGQSLEIEGNIYYSNVSANQLRWYLNGSFVLQGPKFIFNQTKNLSNYKVVCYSSDSCSSVQDSCLMNIQLRDPLSLNLSVKDTTICYGTALSMRAMAQGGLSSQYGYIWQNKLDNSILGIDSILTVQGITQNLKLGVILKDGCTLPMDTMELVISVLKPLNVALVSDVICSNDPIIIKSKASGGKSADYKYKWFLDNATLPDFTDSLKLQPSKLSMVKLVLEDNCSFFGDSASIEIAPLPNFDLENVEIEVCEAYVPNWQAKALNGEIYTYMVKSLNDNKSYALNNMPSYMAGNYEWDILSTNTLGCSDSQKVMTLVKPLPNSDFSWTPDDPSFENPEVTFTSVQASAVAYNWFIDDVLEGKNKLLIKEFSKVGSYNVKLRVEENGCFSETEKSLEFLDTYRWLAVNAFSPNGDGLNDEYKPYVTGAISLEYTIYNRWGEIVFKSDSGASWDGTYQGVKVQSGSYLVIVSARDANFRLYTYKSVVYVL